jgi:hypothetical protein
MYRIDAIFYEIEPVVITKSGGFHIPLTAVLRERRIPGDWRRVVPIWAHVREYEPAKLSHGIGKVLNLFVILAVFGFPRLL